MAPCLATSRVTTEPVLVINSAALQGHVQTVSEHRKSPQFFLTAKSLYCYRKKVFALFLLTSLATGRPDCDRPHLVTGLLQPTGRPVSTQTQQQNRMSHRPTVLPHVPVVTWCFHTHHVSSSAFDHRLDVDAQLLLTSTLRKEVKKAH